MAAIYVSHEVFPDGRDTQALPDQTQQGAPSEPHQGVSTLVQADLIR